MIRVKPDVSTPGWWELSPALWSPGFAHCALLWAWLLTSSAFSHKLRYLITQSTFRSKRNGRACYSFSCFCWQQGVHKYVPSIMTVRSTSQLATSPNSKRLHSHTTGRLFALQSRSIFPRPHQSLGSKLQKHKTQHSYEFSSRQKRAASARQHARAPQASPSDASTESGPKVVGLGLACWDFLAQVASFPKPDEKLRTQRMEVFHWHKCHRFDFRAALYHTLQCACCRQEEAGTVPTL